MRCLCSSHWKHQSFKQIEPPTKALEKRNQCRNFLHNRIQGQQANGSHQQEFDSFGHLVRRGRVEAEQGQIQGTSFFMQNMNTHQEILIDESNAVQTVLAALEELKKNAQKEV